MDDVPRFDNNVNDCQVWQTRCVSSSMKSLHIVECMETLLGVEEVLAFIKRNDFGLYDIWQNKVIFISSRVSRYAQGCNIIYYDMLR